MKLQKMVAIDQATIQAKLCHALLPILLLLIFLSRLPALINFPVFIDETVHLYAAEGVLRESSPLFQVWLGRQLTILLYALFGAPFASPVFVARFVTLLMIMLGAAALLSIAHTFGGLRAMLLTGILYALSPYHLFFERLALADNIAGGLLLLVVWVTMRLRSRVHLGDALAVGILLFLAFGAKVSALTYFVVPLAATVAFSSRYRPIVPIIRWFLVALGVAVLLTGAYILGVRARGMDVISNSLSLASSARSEFDLGQLMSTTRIFSNLFTTIDIIISYSFIIALVGFIGLIVIVMRRQFYLPLVVLVPLLPMLISVVQETRFLVTALALMIATGAVGIADILSLLTPIHRKVILATIIGLAVPSWWNLAVPMYTNSAAIRLPQRDQQQYIESDASGFNLREAASFISQQETVIEIIGALPNCQALRYMTLHSLPVTCPEVSPNPATGIALLDLLSTKDRPGIYLILERNPYIPQNVPGSIMTEINSPIARRPLLVIYQLDS